MFMHPAMISDLVDARRRELHAAAADGRPRPSRAAGRPCRPPRPAARLRAHPAPGRPVTAPASPAARRTGAMLAVACVPAFMTGLDALVVTIALAAIRRDLRASPGQLGWVVNAYVLAFGVLILAGAALGDRLGRRRMFVAGLAVFT